MNHALTAEDLYAEMKRMPTAERVRFFSCARSSAVGVCEDRHIFGMRKANDREPDVIERWNAAGPGWQTRMSGKTSAGTLNTGDPN